MNVPLCVMNVGGKGRLFCCWSGTAKPVGQSASQPASSPASRRVQRCDGVLVQDGIRVQLTLEGRRRREAARARH